MADSWLQLRTWKARLKSSAWELPLCILIRLLIVTTTVLWHISAQYTREDWPSQKTKWRTTIEKSLNDATCRSRRGPRFERIAGTSRDWSRSSFLYLQATTEKQHMMNYKVWTKDGERVEIKNRKESATGELTEFMALQCFVHNNKSQTVNGYLLIEAMHYFRKMFDSWGLPTFHCMKAVEKGIDTAQGKSDVTPRERSRLIGP